MLLGCIADDFTGATDLADTLVREGLRTTLTVGVPDATAAIDASNMDCTIVALKSRTIEPADAVRQSLAALRWLRDAGCRQFFFKYCSTFDSTDRGNIGPVIDALMDALETDFTIACPAFPANGRTIFRGHLFVGDHLLSESGMRDHPLNPMHDSNLVRVLQRQTRRKVGLVRYDTVGAGADAIRSEFDRLAADGVDIAIVDAASNADLRSIGAACSAMTLITGGSGVALGLPANYSVTKTESGADHPAANGRAAVLAGSCSQATNAQVQRWRQSRPSFQIDPLRLAAGHDVCAEALAWAKQHIEPVLIFATASPATLASVQSALGAEHAGALVETCLANIARGLVAQGVTRLIVAGGETSGAVVEALDISTLAVGAPIEPGVPWTTSTGSRPIALALKSGNFGSVDFFGKALRMTEKTDE